MNKETIKIFICMFFVFNLFGCTINKPSLIYKAVPKLSQEHKNNWKNIQGVWYGAHVTTEGLKRIEINTYEADGNSTGVQRYYSGSTLVKETIYHSQWGVVSNIFFDVVDEFISNGKSKKYDKTNPSRFFAYKIISITDDTWIYESLRSGNKYVMKRSLENEPVF